MTPPNDTGPRKIPSIGTAIRNLVPSRDKPLRLNGEIGSLEVGNCWEQPFITENNLFSLLTPEVVKTWVTQFIKEERISLPDQSYLNHNYIFTNLRKTLAILILSGKERAIIYFCKQRDQLQDNKLPISRQDLSVIPDLADSSFFFNQYMFISPRIYDGMPVSISKNHILPIRQRELIKKGFFGTVYKILIDEHQDGISDKNSSADPVWYACKEVKQMKDVDLQKSFDDEVFALNFLKNRTTNVVRLRAHFIHEADTNTTGYMIFDLADCTLEEYMKNNPHPTTKESLHNLLKKASSLASCLSAFHHPKRATGDEEEGLRRIGIHRDLSLHNILVKGDDFMISDFGLARVKEEKVKGDSGTKWPLSDRGPYMAPECHNGATVGRSADVWALGCILLDVLSFGLLGHTNGVLEFRRRRTVTVQTTNGPHQLFAFYENQSVKKKVLDWIEHLRKQPLYDSLVGNYIDVVRAMLRNGPLFDGKEWLSKQVEDHFREIFAGTYRPTSRSNQSRIPQVTTIVGRPGIAPNLPAASSSQTNINGHPSNRQPRRIPSISCPAKGPLKRLTSLDTVFLVDNSTEDSEGWPDMRLTLKQLAEIAIDYDQNGVDLYFVSGQENLHAVLRSQNVEVLLGALDRNIPPPAKFVGLSLKVDKLLSNYVQRYIRAKEKAEHDDMDVDFTNLNLIILTDGRSLLDDVDYRELKNFISVWAKKLDTLAAPISQVGMQFVMINGSDEAPAWKKMKDLDDNLHGKGTIRDIVDARIYNPNTDSNNNSLLEAILLGGNYKTYDEDLLSVNGTSAI